MKKINILIVFCFGLLISSCNDYLDIEPESTITPENYLNSEDQLASYTINLYTNDTYPIPSIGSGYRNKNDFALAGEDLGTDNQNTNKVIPEKFVESNYRIPESDGKYNFTSIRNVNYFLDQVIPKYEAGVIKGDAKMISHYIGEAYFFRAAAYFRRLMELGDFPIVKTALTNNIEALKAASIRVPRNEVARFILEDLTRAEEMMQTASPDGKKNRLYADVATLYKARVALYEGTFLKNFKNTPFVPGGPNWPGEAKQYKGYIYPSGSIDNEIEFFLTQAMKSSKIIADKYKLVENTGSLLDNPSIVNPYMSMFADTDLSSYSEVLLWRKYNGSLGPRNLTSMLASMGNGGIGLTRGVIRCFVDKNGLPPYAKGSLWADNQENDIHLVTKNRDSRAQLFIKLPNQVNIITNESAVSGGGRIKEDPAPEINTSSQYNLYTTGYASRKYLNPDGIHCNTNGYSTAPSFRASEAYLIYVEACYEKTNTIDSDADKYWKAIRKRALINIENDGDWRVTVENTDMNEEGRFDWAAYTNGILISPTLYCIRRERRCEFLMEGMRFDDLVRWKALDQLKTQKYHIEGMKLWNSPNEALLKSNYGDNYLVPFEGSKNNSDFLRLYQQATGSLAYDGFTWYYAHYLEPIAIQHLRITAADVNDLTTSSLYQNPYWSLEAGATAIE